MDLAPRWQGRRSARQRDLSRGLCRLHQRPWSQRGSSPAPRWCSHWIQRGLASGRAVQFVQRRCLVCWVAQAGQKQGPQRGWALHRGRTLDQRQRQAGRPGRMPMRLPALLVRRVMTRMIVVRAGQRRTLAGMVVQTRPPAEQAGQRRECRRGWVSGPGPRAVRRRRRRVVKARQTLTECCRLPWKRGSPAPGRHPFALPALLLQTPQRGLPACLRGRRRACWDAETLVRR